MAAEAIRRAIKMDLPAFPDEVVDTWLLPIAQDAGWPPVPFSSWDRILLQRPVAFWRNLRWEKRRVPLAAWMIEAESLDRIRGLIDANVRGVTNAYSLKITNTKERFESIVNHLRSFGRLPVPPVLLHLGLQYVVADGNHRVAALFHVGQSPFGPECWVARSGELGAGLTSAWSRPA